MPEPETPQSPASPEIPQRRLPAWLWITLWAIIPIFVLIPGFFFGPDVIAIGLKYESTRPYSQKVLMWLGPIAIRPILAADEPCWPWSDPHGYGRGYESVEEICQGAEANPLKRFVLMIALRNSNFTGTRGVTLLYFASAGDYPNLIRELLRRGANVNAKIEGGCVPLDRATESGHKDIVELLIAHGADVNAKNNLGRPPLYFISRHSRDVAELLIAHGADVNSKDKFGRTPLHYLSEEHHASKDVKDVAEILISHGADINAKDNDGRTPLKIAREHYSPEIVDFLRAHGATE